MPHHDGTGPGGEGPMTGRGLGYCVIPLSTSAEELGYLEKREKALKQELARIRGRMRQIKEPASAVRSEP
jgi:hypothetical protein